MPDFIKRAAVIITAISAVMILFFSNFGASGDRIIRYDCRDAHWMPDIPVEVKQECQRIMYERWKQEQEEKRSRIST
jgi:hypothetical protein